MEQNSKKTKKAEAEISLLNNATFPCSPTYRLTQGGCCKSHFTRTHDVKNSLFHPHCQPCWDTKLSKLLTLRNRTAQISSGLVPALFKRTYSHSKDQFPSIEGPNPRAPPVQHWNIIVPFDLSFSLTWLIFTFHFGNNSFHCSRTGTKSSSTARRTRRRLGNNTSTFSYVRFDI